MGNKAKKATPQPQKKSSRSSRSSPAGPLLVFVGPSLPSAEARALAPRAEIRPPIAVGELLTLARRRRPPACVAILDGYFERMAAVWHKEILVALSRGIAVYGAASMGALRAAELGPWGMIGVGEIHRAFAAGELEADDEVAVAHLSADLDHRPISDALVNLRDGLRRAAAERVVSAKLAAQLAQLARARPYRERSWRQLGEDAVAAGLPKKSMAALAAWVARVRPDRKGDDARLLLRQLHTSGWRRPELLAVPRTWALEQLEAILAGP